MLIADKTSKDTKIKMDKNAISDYINAKCRDYELLSHRDIYDLIRHKDEIDIPRMKDVLFKKRLDYFTLAKYLKVSMLRDTGYKQLKKYFRYEMDMEEKQAQLAADRYNSASRTYDKFDIIIKNLSEFPKIDIRDLSIVELRLAVNIEWVRLRSASIHLNGKKREANEDIGQPQKQVNWGKVYQHADTVRQEDWYQENKLDPSFMGEIMDKYATHVVMQSQLAAKRARR